MPYSDFQAIALQGDGRVVAGGAAKNAGGRTDFLVVRVDANGNFDSSFGSGGAVVTQFGLGSTPNAYVSTLAVQPDGKIVTGGGASGAGGQDELAVARLGANGPFDPSFGSGGRTVMQLGAGSSPYTIVNSLALEPDGQIVAGGEATDASGRGQVMLARFSGIDGRFDPGFGSGGVVLAQKGFGGRPLSALYALAIQPDGKVVISGYAQDVGGGGESRLLVARLIADLAPTAAFSVLTSPALAGSPVAFDGSASSDPDGSLASFEWDFGDGANGTGPTPSHTYASAGTYTVALKVTDADKLTATTTAPVTVAVPLAPLAVLSLLRVSPRNVLAATRGAMFSRRKAGATVTYVDSQAGVTTLTVEKPKAGVRKGKRCVKPPRRPSTRAKRCTRWVAMGSSAHKDVAGKNKLRFTGRVKNRKLAPGRYRLRAVARFAGRAGAPVTTSFRIVR
jgi:uncharacterized delta-60 repeat protein